MANYLVLDLHKIQQFADMLWTNYLTSIQSLLEVVAFYKTESLQRRTQKPVVFTDPEVSVNGIAYSTRAQWMRVANMALLASGSPCPFAAFGSAIVNHSSGISPGELICTGTNNITTGNPTLHGEIVAINNCTSILADPQGPFKLSPSEISKAWADLTIYTNAESCPMCATAIRWAGFKEYVYGSSIDRLVKKGWRQITVDSYEIFEQSWSIGTGTTFLAGVLANDTDPYFLWQFQPDYPCPAGCARTTKGNCAAK